MEQDPRGKKEREKGRKKERKLIKTLAIPLGGAEVWMEMHQSDSMGGGERCC